MPPGLMDSQDERWDSMMDAEIQLATDVVYVLSVPSCRRITQLK